MMATLTALFMFATMPTTWAFSPCSTSARMHPFGVQGVTMHQQARTLASTLQPSTHRTLLSASTDATEPETNDEVQRLQAMAAKLRQEAAELELQQASERARAVEIAFDKFDTNHDGALSLDELKAALEKTFQLNLPEERVQRLLDDFDTSGDGKIQKDEFVSMDAFRNRLESLAAEERQEALAATRIAQKEEEVAAFLEAQLDKINDKPPSPTDKVVSVLPYLFPLMDGLLYGNFLLSGQESNPIVAVLGLLYTFYRAIPFGGVLTFFGLSGLSNNLSVNRLVRYNAQQAIFLDIALFVPGLLGALAGFAASGLGVTVPQTITELSSDALFVSLLAILGYSVVSSLAGVTPDRIPLISQAVTKRLPTADSIDFIDPRTGKSILRNRNKDDEDDEESK